MILKHRYLFILLTAVLTGCGDAPLVRHYEEIFIEADRSQMAHTSHDGDQHMRAEAMPPGLDVNNMPQDAIHAGLDVNVMPQDAIHAGLNVNTMSQDAAHAQVNTGADSAVSTQQSTGSDMASMPISPELERSVDRSPLNWKTPQGWSERKGSGMRLVTFSGNSPEGETETTIISLGGQAGGLEANVTRWVRQIGLNISPAELQIFLSQQQGITTVSGLQTTLVDLTQLQNSLPGTAPSMIAAIIDRGRSQIFIKMTGSKDAVHSQLENFRTLITSISE
ncbi:MAG: hypothetical protein K8I82_29985 [Anaerolineae bacterium]|nr:hypothetical protein [Anaerolineae bacterium]